MLKESYEYVRLLFYLFNYEAAKIHLYNKIVMLMSHPKFKIGDTVIVKTIIHTKIKFSHVPNMYNVGDMFTIKEVISEYEVWDENNWAYHTDDLELVTNEIFEIDHRFNFDKFLAHLSLQIIKN